MDQRTLTTYFDYLDAGRETDIGPMLGLVNDYDLSMEDAERVYILWVKTKYKTTMKDRVLRAIEIDKEGRR